MEIVKIGILGVAGVMLALQFKSNRPEIGIYMGIAVCLIIFALSVDGLSSILKRMQVLEKYLGDNTEYLVFLLKAVGITYVCEFCASVCKDAGYNGVAGQIELFGKLSVLMMGMPVLTAVIENINAMGGL
ncbi:MAG: stage III sporulation protein AD [Lachnospiraceae bacterium]|nr:stage III sporulation protein AD [Lachnospiraceae bacterium]